MTTRVIIYKRPDDGGVSILIPQEPYLSMLGLDLIAAKDVPEGVAYKIIDRADVPPPGERDGWMQDNAEYIDGVGKGQYIEAPKQPVETGSDDVYPGRAIGSVGRRR